MVLDRHHRFGRADLSQNAVAVERRVMCLLVGTMAEEESWAPVKLLIRKITSERIGQIWLHHTGHDTSKSFGTKTREWEMDTVLKLTTGEDDQSIFMEFTKARLRMPKTASQFKPRTIVRDETGWTVIGEGQTTTAKSDVEILKRAIMDAYDRLADGVSTTSPGFNGAPVKKVSADAVRDQVKQRGFLDIDDKGFITAAARKQLQRARAALLADPKPRLAQDGDLIWRP